MKTNDEREGQGQDKAFEVRVTALYREKDKNYDCEEPRPMDKLDAISRSANIGCSTITGHASSDVTPIPASRAMSA